MKNYTVIATFTYPSELIVIKGLLESNGIECYVRDELTVQVHNFYSNAIGGIRMEIPDDQIDLAKKLIIESGFKNHLSINENSNSVKNSNQSILKIIKLGVIFSIIATIILFGVIYGLSL